MPSAKPSAAPLASEAAKATAALGAATIEIHYDTPQLRGREVSVGLVPYNDVWRTGPNPATTIVTSSPLLLNVPMSV